MRIQFLFNSSIFNRGHSITTYVDKMRGEGVKKCLFFVHAQGKKLSTQGWGVGGGWGQKMAKFCPRSCWMTPILKILEIFCFLEVHIFNVKIELYVPCWLVATDVGSIFSNVTGLVKITCPAVVTIEAVGKVMEVKAVVLVETGAVVKTGLSITVSEIAVVKAPTLGKSLIFMSPKSSYRLWEKVSAPISRKVVELSGTLGTEAANWNRFSAPESKVIELISGGLSNSIFPVL